MEEGISIQGESTGGGEKMSEQSRERGVTGLLSLHPFIRAIGALDRGRGNPAGDGGRKKTNN